MGLIEPSELGRSPLALLARILYQSDDKWGCRTVPMEKVEVRTALALAIAPGALEGPLSRKRF